MEPLTLRRQGRIFSWEKFYSELSNTGILSRFSRSSKTNQPNIIWMGWHIWEWFEEAICCKCKQKALRAVF